MASEAGVVLSPEAGQAGKWTYHLTPDEGALEEGHHVFSAEATDQVGLSSPVCNALSGPSTCWIGVLVIDRTAPTITEASLDLEGDEGASVKAGAVVSLSATITDTVATR